MEVREIQNKKRWEDFLLECTEKTFLQAWNWGEFQKLIGNKIWRIGVFENGELVSIFLIIKILAKRGTFLLIPHGPVMILETYKLKRDSLTAVKNKLKELAVLEKVDFIRISPIWKRTEDNN